MKKSLILCKFVLKTWGKEFQRFINTMPKKIMFFAMGILIIGFGSFLGYQLTKEIIDNFFSQKNISSIKLLVITMSINVSVITASLFLVLKMITSEQNTYFKLISWLPFNRFEKNLGLFLPFFLAVETTVLFLVSILLIPAFIANSFGLYNTLIFLVSVQLQSILTITIINMVINIIQFILKKVRIPFEKTISITIVFFLVFYNLFKYNNINEIAANLGNSKIDFNIFNIFSVIALAGLNQMYLGVKELLLIFGLCLLIIMGICISILFTPKESDNNIQKPIKSIAFTNSVIINLSIKEYFIQIREKQNITSLLTLWALIIIIRTQTGTDFVNFITVGTAGLTGMIMFNAYSQCSNYIKLYKLYRISTLTLLIGKLLGGLFLQISIFLLFIYSTLTFADFFVYKYALIAIIVSNLFFFLIGIIAPPKESAPLVSSLVVIGAILVAIPLMFIGSFLTQSLKVNYVVSGILLILFLLLSSYKLLSWRCSNESY